LLRDSDTRTRILDSAERLFAEAGFAATSVRGITADAGVNLAAVNYHFGSKDALLVAVLERRLAPVNSERLRRLDALEEAAGGQALDPETALRAFLEPPFRKMREWGDGGQKFMQLVGRILSDTNPRMQAIFVERFEEILARFTKALQRALPELAPEEVSRRLHFVIGGMAHTLTWSHKIARLSGQKRPDMHSMLEDLVQFAAAGMKAPVPLPERGGKS
jgi:AcrR family transcriptional regulator